jgi:succinylarginine dihydrolase
VSITVEINFDGLIGPSHNYAGLSLGNIASSSNQGGVSKPRMAALQGLAKMRLMLSLGLLQGILPPHPRPDVNTLQSLGFSGTPADMYAACWKADPKLFANLFSASAMWTANAATISPGADTADGKLHVSVANLVGNLHRSREADFTHQLLVTLFADEHHFTVHDALPMALQLGDEGAANHGRLVGANAALELFVHGDNPLGTFPARQNLRASEAIARRHQLGSKAIFLQQSNMAIEAGAFHNDVVSVANGHVLFAHEHAFEHRAPAYAALKAALPDIHIIDVLDTDVPLADAIKSYLFNSQLVTLPDGTMALILPGEVREIASTHRYLENLLATDTPIKSIHIVDVRESMRNGGGPACLRLRVAVTAQELAALDQRFLLDAEKIDRLEQIVAATYPDEISAADLGNPALHEQVHQATAAVYAGLGLEGLIP